MKVVVTAQAFADLERLAAFLAVETPASAARLLARLNESLLTLETLPDRSRPIGNRGLRELIVPFGRTSYVIRYSRVDDAGIVLILRIWNSREHRE